MSDQKRKTFVYAQKLVVVHGSESEAEFMGGFEGERGIETWAIENLPEGIYSVRFQASVDSEAVEDEPEGGGFDAAVRGQAKTLANMAHEAGDAVAELQLRSIAKHGLTDARTLNPPTPTTGGSEVVGDE